MQLEAATPLSAQAGLPPDLAAKFQALLDYLAQFDRVITGFSGGVDSSLVAFVAHRVLGERALAVTSGSASLNRDDLALTRRLAAEWGMAHEVIETQELENPSYLANPSNRCYYCKTTLYTDLETLAARAGDATLLNGTNVDDLGDHRPGLLAASEHRVRSPLADCGFTKAEIRALATHLGLPNADKPQAACLSSRVPYGISISIPVLQQIEAAEQVLKKLGLRQVRVRHHDTVARIEVAPEEFPLVLEHREAIERDLRALGYRYVTLDLKGFRSGSLNEGLKTGKPKNEPQ
jgi:uncharacterized protein